MSGRPVRLLAAATVAAAASLLSTATASAGCYSGCGGYSYSAPVAYYTAPVVYSYSYAAPVSYAAPCSPCGGSFGYGSYGYAPSRPMYVVNQGPSYTEPVVGEAEGVVELGYSRPYPYLGGGGVRWHRGYGHRSYGYRSQGYGYRGHRYGYRSYGHGARFGYRSGWRARHAIVGHGGIWRGGMHRMHGPRMGMYGPRMGMHGPRHMNMHRMHMNRVPGVVHPMGGPKKRWP
jgi:hypothetical protein